MPSDENCDDREIVNGEAVGSAPGYAAMRAEIDRSTARASTDVDVNRSVNPAVVALRIDLVDGSISYTMSADQAEELAADLECAAHQLRSDDDH